MKKQVNQRIQYALKTGTTLLDRYVIKAVLGQNGLSITYRAYDTFRDQTVALKELYPSAIVARNFDDELNVECVQLSNEQLFEQMKAQCVQKAKKMIRLYPLTGMANIIHYIEANQTVYFVMEYVEGIDLPTFLKKKHTDKMELKKTINLLQPVFDSLELVHRAGIFHGRISPESIVMDEKRHAILLGFGDPMEEVAQDVLGETTARELAFAPVEQYVPGGAQGATTDVYAIAAVVYFCITGIRPPAFYDRVGGVTGENDPLVSPWELKIPIMESQSAVIMKALAVYTFDRYQSIYDFVGALGVDEFEDDPGELFRSREPEKFRKRESRRKWFKRLLAVAVIVLLCVVVPKIYRGVWSYQTNRFYQNFEAASMYDKCVMLSGLSDAQKNHFGNNYEVLKEDEKNAIKYFDLNEKACVPFKAVTTAGEEQEYLVIDFRKNNQVWVGYLTGDATTYYYMDLNKNGSYYQIEKTVTQSGSQQSDEFFKVSAQEKNGV